MSTIEGEQRPVAVSTIEGEQRPSAVSTIKGEGSVSTREEEERPDGRSVCFHWSKSERASQTNVPLNRKLEIA